MYGGRTSSGGERHDGRTGDAGTQGQGYRTGFAHGGGKGADSGLGRKRKEVSVCSRKTL